MQRIVFLIPYFGPWPVWIDHFIESCRANKTIDWILFSDADPPANSAPNVTQVTMSFEHYKALVAERVGILFDPDEPYKLCDLKPALAYVHADLVRGYDFVGFGDLDVIYGDLRLFLSSDTLNSYDLISTHADRISGHLCLLRNQPHVVTAFRQARGWRESLERQDHVSFDEEAFFRVFRPARSDLIGRWRGSPCRVLLREAYSTPAATQDMKWYWEKGRLSNEFYPENSFMYLHFMSWHSNRWYAGKSAIEHGAVAPWKRLERIVQVDWRAAPCDGFMISPGGITDIVKTSYR